MATKLELINQLYDEETKELSSPTKWMEFLSSACRNYKCRFDEQVLIYAQKPDAIAVLELEKWNKNFSRWVNKGATGIAVFDSDKTERRRLKYYFDVSDTHENRYSRPVTFWQMTAEYESEVIETLENTFGDLETKSTLPLAIISAAQNAVDDNIGDYLSDLKYCLEDSYLEDMGEDYIQKTFKELITNSIAYMLMTRCGYNVADHFDEDDFRAITDFNTKDALTPLGLATSDISEMGLREIATTIFALRKNEKNTIRTFVEPNKESYNDFNKKEKENDYGDNIQQSGRLQPTEPNTSRRGGNPPWEVRTPEKELFGEETQSDLRQSSNFLQVEPTLDGNREPSLRDDGEIDKGNGESSGSDRTTQSQRPNDLGGNDERNQTLSRGSGSERTDLRLENTLPSVDEQLKTIEEAEVKNTSAFSISQEEIDSVLQTGTGFVDGKFRVYEHFQKKESNEVNATFLKNEYGTGGSYPAVVGTKLDQDHDSKGMKIQKSEVIGMPLATVTLPWTKVAKRIDELISLDRYLNEKEKLKLPNYRAEKKIQNERNRIGTAFNELIRNYNSYQTELKSDDRLDQNLLTACGSSFSQGRLKTYLSEEYILPIMTKALRTIIDEDTHFTDTANTLLNDLNGDIAKLFRPLSIRLAEFYLEFDHYDFQDNLNTDESIVDVVNQLEKDLTNETSVKDMVTTLSSIRDESDDTEEIKLLSGFIKELEDIYFEPQYEYQYHLGDKVYIGANEYEILSFDDEEVLLYDFELPLFNKQFERNDFDKKVQENPSNDHLKVIVSNEKQVEPSKEQEEIRYEVTETSDAFGEEDAFAIWDKKEETYYYDADSWMPTFETEDEATNYLNNLLGNPLSKEPLINENSDKIKIPEHSGTWYVIDSKTINDKTYFLLEHEVYGDMSANLIIDEHQNLVLDSVWNGFSDLDEFLEMNEEEKEERLGVTPFITDNMESLEYSIYQLKDSDELRMYRFSGMKELEQQGLSVNGSNYELVYTGTTNAENNTNNLLNNIYEKFNLNHPSDFKGHSLSVSDVIIIGGTAHFVDSFGFSEQPNFINELTSTEKETTNSQYVETNIGNVPLEDYMDIKAVQNGFDSYEDMVNQGFHIDKPETFEMETQSNDDLIGKELNIDNRKYVVESIRSLTGDVSMRDITFEDNVGIPINRLENAEYIRHLVEEQSKADELPPLCTPSKAKVRTNDLHPDPKAKDRNQFIITDNELGFGSPKEKFTANINAIKVLKLCEKENRFATPTEQEILSKYVGFGGLSDAFDDGKSAWANEYLELKNLLDSEEYAAARESTLTAFYTSPVVISSMYQVLSNMGFSKGNILEPSCGVGNFIGTLPESMKDSKVYGVELDSITGRIAQQLYQKSSIAVAGYEDTTLPDSFFDVAIGNVPFGQFKVSDKKYDKQNWLIHDYFFGKTLDKVRPGGVIAFITSKGTLDKENPAVRKYIAGRADLLGAIRLPNNAFKANAGTEVTSDIIFLQKRDRVIDIEPDWVHLGKDENGLTMNQYFIDNPEMIMGEMKEVSGPYGPETACVPYLDQTLEELLSNAIPNINAEMIEYEQDDLAEIDDDVIPADPSVRNFSYTLYDGKIYFRENSIMKPIDASDTAINRIKGMVEIRDCVRSLIEMQTEDYPNEDIEAEQKRLNTLYDTYTKKYGLLSNRANSTAFSTDSSYCLLCSLEVVNDNGELERKADMFHKRTIKPHIPVTSVDTASEALAVSIAEKANVDMDFMEELTGKTEQEIFEDLKGVIFLNPMYGYSNSTETKYLMADEYLSGNVREKLEWAKKSAQLYPDDYTVNVEALERVQPVDLTASEIAVRLGATWLPTEIAQQFMYELLETPRYAQYNIKVHYSPLTAEWNVEGKSYDRGNVKANNTYGSTRINGYKIIEETLNLKDVRIFDYVEDENGNKKAVLNKKETAIAQAKQELIKSAFADWIWKDPNRREKLTRMYNDKFNNTRPREYDGSHISFGGINPEIKLRPHQVNAIAHIMYGGNTLLAHCVGAGKTFEMIAAAMESKRLGLCSKSLFVVPNHLTEQWATEFLQLYPSANILVATKKDFEMKNRKKFCGRIATGDYDAVIIGHSQFEKIPMSFERQRGILEEQMNEVLMGIDELKRNRGENFSIKQLEKTRKSLKTKLDKLNDQSRKDDVVTFEELGVDRVFIDESHYYKNLFLYTKMRNVGGIAQTEAQKSSDLFMKCRYLDELTGGRGVIFATGTPISNSMVEMYTIQRYLQYGALQQHGLQHFDCWASTFGETVTAIELAPEGTGYRAKTRFAKFYNLPELMCMFKEVADIQTADMLNLPVPQADYHNVSVKPSEIQKEMVADLSERADRVRNKMVDASIDNMLKITNDGRKLALDQRLINEMLPDEETSKVNACTDNIYKIWENNTDKRSTQLVFCDLSTPKKDDVFSVYTDIRNKLIERGIPADEVRFIHEADTETKKKELFNKVRKGDVRVLFGSTQKMGAGTNVQNRLIALHDIDCPWRPSDLEQRSGRIIRQGNENPKVDIFRYVTEQTFDAYLYQLVENKQKFISQIMTSKSPVRSAEDIDETALSYAEIKMLATGNPHIKEKMDLDIQVAKLKLLKQNHLSERYSLEDKILKTYPKEIKYLEERIKGFETDNTTALSHTSTSEDKFIGMTIKDKTYAEKADAGNAILATCKSMTKPDPIPIGAYRGFDMNLEFDTFSKEYKITLKGAISHKVSLGTDVYGNITRLDNALSGLNDKKLAAQQLLENTCNQLENAKLEVEKPFVKEQELKEKTKRLDELNILLNMDKTENEIVDGDVDQANESPDKKPKDYER